MSMFEKQPPGLAFLLKSLSHEGEECLIWPFSCCTAGYGNFMANKKRGLAHREMCRMAHGEPPTPDHHAAHSCGNRRCINPRHISWKTQSDNQLDRRQHGTVKRTYTKITAEQAAQIRQLKEKETSIETAAKYG